MGLARFSPLIARMEPQVCRGVALSQPASANGFGILMGMVFSLVLVLSDYPIIVLIHIVCCKEKNGGEVEIV